MKLNRNYIEFIVTIITFIAIMIVLLVATAIVATLISNIILALFLWLVIVGLGSIGIVFLNAYLLQKLEELYGN